MANNPEKLQNTPITSLDALKVKMEDLQSRPEQSYETEKTATLAGTLEQLVLLNDGVREENSNELLASNPNPATYEVLSTS